MDQKTLSLAPVRTVHLASAGLYTLGAAFSFAGIPIADRPCIRPAVLRGLLGLFRPGDADCQVGVAFALRQLRMQNPMLHDTALRFPDMRGQVFSITNGIYRLTLLPPVSPDADVVCLEFGFCTTSENQADRARRVKRLLFGLLPPTRPLAFLPPGETDPALMANAPHPCYRTEEYVLLPHGMGPNGGWFYYVEGMHPPNDWILTW